MAARIGLVKLKGNRLVLVAPGVGAAVLELVDESGDQWIWAHQCSGSMTEDMARLLAMGIASKDDASSAWSRLCASSRVDDSGRTISHLILVLSTLGLVRSHAELARIMGVSVQRVRQMSSDPMTRPTGEAVNRLRQWLSNLVVEHRDSLLAMLDEIESDSRRKLRGRYSRES